MIIFCVEFGVLSLLPWCRSLTHVENKKILPASSLANLSAVGINFEYQSRILLLLEYNLNSTYLLNKAMSGQTAISRAWSCFVLGGNRKRTQHRSRTTTKLTTPPPLTIKTRFCSYTTEKIISSCPPEKRIELHRQPSFGKSPRRKEVWSSFESAIRFDISLANGVNLVRIEDSKDFSLFIGLTITM